MKKSFKKLSLEKQTVSKLVQTRINGGENSYVCTKEYSKDYGDACSGGPNGTWPIRTEACNGDQQ